MSKKKEDKIISIKCKISDIIKSNDKLDILFNACIRCNKLTIYTYQFLRLWILSKYNDKSSEIPKVTKIIIKQAMIVLLKDKNTDVKIKGKNKSYLEEFNNFYNKTFYKLNNVDKIDGINLSNIVDEIATCIVTSIENNIKLNYHSYIRRFINSSFKLLNKNIINNTESKYKREIAKELSKDLREIKLDIFNNTLLSNEKYHNWIELHRHNIILNNLDLDVDLKANSQKYMKCMIYMCLEIEKLGTKSFQFFPLRNSIYPKYFPINTTILVDLLPFDEMNKNNKTLLSILFPSKQPKNNEYFTKTELKQNIMLFQNYIWNEVFDIDKILANKTNKAYNKKYSLNYSGTTNCFDISLQYINNKYIDSKLNKIKNNQASIKTNNKLRKNMNEKEQIKFKEEIIKKEDDNKLKIIIKNKEFKDKKIKEFKMKPKEEKTEIIKSLKDFKYIDDLNSN